MIRHRLSYWFVLSLVALYAAPAYATEILCVWQGPSGGWWTTTDNWACGVTGGPCNAGNTEFNVEIPANMGTVVLNVAAGECVIKRLTLGDNTKLQIQDGATLTVEEDTNICGIIDADDDFLAEHETLVQFSCNRARV